MPFHSTMVPFLVQTSLTSWYSDRFHRTEHSRSVAPYTRLRQPAYEQSPGSVLCKHLESTRHPGG
eukprot:1486155-Rhodomonas_salina.2